VALRVDLQEYPPNHTEDVTAGVCTVGARINVWVLVSFAG
jgi:hypothetical protein